MLELKNISKSYDNKKIISSLNLSFNKHGIYTLMSPSGSGKTTLLRLLSGLEKPDGGQIVSDLNPPSFLFQEERFFDHLSLYENLALIEKDCDGLLKRFGLYGAKDLNIRELSGGMQRRASLIRALLFKSNFMLLDEPFSGLDKILRDSIMDIIKEYRTLKTIILTSHDLYEALYLSDEIIIFDERFTFKNIINPDNSCHVSELVKKYEDFTF